MSTPGTLDRLPIIDIAPLLNSDPCDSDKRAATAAALHSACVDYGFFYLDLQAYVDPSEPEELARLAKQFFNLPQEEKDKLALKNQDNARGTPVFVGSSDMIMLTQYLHYRLCQIE